MLAAALLLLGLPAPAFAYEIIVITGIHAGSPVMGTQDDCNGYVEHDNPVVPMTINAAFFGEDPTGPYATGEWDGGFGSWDDHFGSGMAHDHYQHFHVLLRSGTLSGYYGPGEYGLYATVQDVGVGPALTQSASTAFIGAASPTVAKVKCTLVGPLGPEYVLDQVKDAAIDKLKEAVCAVCVQAKGMYDTLQGYNDALNGLMYDSMVDDPPDPDYQTLATPGAAPVLPPPAGLTSAQQAAYTKLATRLASQVGLGRAIYDTVNRVWGADNAASTFWHRKQLAHLADLSQQAAAGYDVLPQLWADLTATLSGLPSATITPLDVNHGLSGLDVGLSPERSAVLTQLGVSDADQRDIATLYATYVDPLTVEPTSLTDALSGTNAADMASSMRTWRQWALSAIEQDAPVISSVEESTVPSSGYVWFTFHGAHLRNVTGVNFGPSSVGHGQAGKVADGCSDTECTVVAPPGHGTVDVVAVGPGGTSQPSDATKVTYGEPPTPHVTKIFPAQGAAAGGTQVSVFGSGLDGGRVDFGTLPADEWACHPTRCVAKAPPSGTAGPVDVTVVNGDHRSTKAAAATFTYLADAPPPPAAPVVTGVSPNHGSDLGGQQVTITGSSFTAASGVRFGDYDDADDFAVQDDSHIVVTVPDYLELGANHVTVTGPGGTSATSAADVFTAETVKPVVTSISPSTGPDTGGTTVTITGTNLTQGDITIGGYGVDTYSCAPTSCTFVTPPLSPGDSLGGKHVRVDTYDGTSAATSADLFTYTADADPVVTGVLPDTGSTAGGDTVVITGQHLGGGSVRIGGIDADSVDYGSCAMTSCVVTAPAHAAGDAPVVVKTHSGTSAPADAATYSFIAPARPVVTGISPDQDWRNGTQDVTITGHHLSQGTVWFGNTAVDYGADCTVSECVVTDVPHPAHAKTVDVTVRTGGGTSATGAQTTFTWIAPTVTSVTPSTGWTDGTTEVTVTGTHLLDGYVDFGTEGRGPCESDTVCHVTAPTAYATGPVDVTVENADGTTSSEVVPAGVFTYTQRPLPTITAVTPDHGSKEGHETTTVTGTYLAGASIKVNGYGASQVSCTMTSCTFETPYSSTAGTVQVVAHTSAGDSATGSGSAYTYQVPAVPTITSVSPSTGSTEGGTTLTVTGTGLANAAVFIGGTQQNADCDRTSCEVVTRAHAAGTLDVKATTNGGTSAITAATKYTYAVPPAPVVTSVDPGTGPSSGGDQLTLTGHDLYGGQVTFDGTAVTGEKCDATTCTFTSPGGAAGDVDVTVTTDGGTSAPVTFHDDSVHLAEVPVPGLTASARGGEIIRGIGGDLWFALPNDDSIGRIASDGTITKYPTPTGSEPLGITQGPDGRMWFTEPGTMHIGAMSADGTMVDYPVPGGAKDLRFITPGPDGRLWFDLTSGAVGAITTSGQVTEWQVPDPSVVPYHLLAGPDGRVWFTEWGGRSIGAVTPDGVITEYPLGAPDLLSWDLKTGPDDRLWLTQAVGEAIAAVDTSTGRVTTYKLPSTVANPQGMVYGPDGRFWFVTPDIDRLSAWDPASGDLTYYTMPPHTGAVNPKYVAMDRHGDLWATETNGRALVHLTGIDQSGTPGVTHVAPAYGASGDTVTLTGSRLGDATAVTVGGTSASFTVTDPAHLTVTVPAGSGAADVRVTTPDGTSPVASGAVFHYGSPPPPAPSITDVEPASGPTAGGTTVTVTGQHLSGAALAVGGTPATGVSCTASSCTATVPAGPVGTVHVVATTAAGSSATSSVDRYTYLAPAPPAPAVTGLSPGSGPASGGTSVTITGTHLGDGTVWFGDSVGASSCSATSCTATSPAGAPGTVHVRVTTAGGTSPRVAADRFTYLGSGTTTSSVTLTTNPTSSVVGQSVKLTAHVTPTAATGPVVFRDGGVALGQADVASGTASLTLTSLTQGTHQLSVTYAGDATYASSQSPAVSFTVDPAPDKQPTTTTLTATPHDVVQYSDVKLKATVSPSTATGTVTFADADGVIGTADLANGVATYDAWTLSPGSHAITASYAGALAYEPSQSSPVTVTVTQKKTTTTTLTTSASTVRKGAAVTFTAKLSPTSATGIVTFLLDSSTVLGSKTLSSGTASVTTKSLAVGEHSVYAYYTGDPTHTGSQSSAVTVTVKPRPKAPGPPRHVTAKAGHHQVTVAWRKPLSPGSAKIQHYVVVTYRGATKVKKNATHGVAYGLTVTKLKPGVGYRFKVYAVNKYGDGKKSAYTDVVRPKP